MTTTDNEEQLEAWSQFFRLLPTVLPDTITDRHGVLEQMPIIREVCQQGNLSSLDIFTRLKSVSSLFVHEIRMEQQRRLGFEFELSSTDGEGEEAERPNQSPPKKQRTLAEEGIRFKLHAFEQDPEARDGFVSFLKRHAKELDEGEWDNDESQQNEEAEETEVREEHVIDDDIQIIYDGNEDRNDEDEDAQALSPPQSDQDDASIDGNNDEEEEEDEDIPDQSMHDQSINDQSINDQSMNDQSTTLIKPTCKRCQGPVSKRTVTYCRTCRNEVNREEKLEREEKILNQSRRSDPTLRGTSGRTCNSCNGPISSGSRGLCKSCHLAIRAGTASNRLSITNDSNSTAAVLETTTNSNTSTTGSNAATIQFNLEEAARDARLYRNPANRVKIICVRCNHERIRFAQQMCQTCYKTFRKENTVVLVKREFFESVNPNDVNQEESEQTPEPSQSTEPPKTRKSEPLLRKPKVEIEELPQTELRRGVKRTRASDYVNDRVNQPVEEEIPNKQRRTKACLDCQAPIYPESDRCKACFYDFKKRSKLGSGSTPSSSHLDTNDSSDRKHRSCLRCSKTISNHGKTGYCHQCYFIHQKEQETVVEQTAPTNEVKENLKPSRSSNVVQPSNDNPDNSVEILEENNEEEQTPEECVVCHEPINRRTTTGTCTTRCYKRLYTQQKRAEQSSMMNELMDRTQAAIDRNNEATNDHQMNDEEEQKEEITEESLLQFDGPPRPCQSCWSFSELNNRRLCSNCHGKEMDDAHKAAEQTGRLTFEVYLEQTEQFQNDD